MQETFTIKYRFHWCGPCVQYEDTKDETVIDSDGRFIVRHYDHHGPNGHFRLIRRTTGSADPKEIEKLYEALLNIIHVHNGCAASTDVDAEVILAEPGLKISADAFLTDEDSNLSSLIEEFMKDLNLQ